MSQFVHVDPGHRRNSARKSRQEWDKWKPIIIEKYRKMALKDVRVSMEREYGFSATKRQYGNTIQVIWKISKYKKKPAPGESRPNVPPPNNAVPAEEGSANRGTLSHNCPAALPGEPSTWVPRLDCADARARHLCLSETLLAFGDSRYSFVINSALWNHALWDEESLVAYSVACVRTAQTPADAKQARYMVHASTARLPGTDDENCWVTWLFDLLCAQTYVWGADVSNGLDQIVAVIVELILEDDQGRDCLKRLVPRGPFLDIPVYILLRSALVWYNSEQVEGEIDIPAMMKQFLGQQPAFFPYGLDYMETDPLLAIDCLSSCLTWCTVTLESCDSPPAVPGADGNPLTEVYIVLCTFWQTWMSAPWAVNVMPQLGISAIELLSTMVCMIMSAATQSVNPSSPVLGRALAGAHALWNMSPRDFIDRFLGQVWATNRRLMALPDDAQGSHLQDNAVHAEMIEPFRRFVAQSLGIDDLPVLERGSLVYPMVLAG
ncbi:hypothetical protein C8A00DRAFT_31735 [Chaetomidium leptoderma]|uniref:Clr5 domain-containing protein n=1 Tax=Chaetomidium leptoderma TaxID=669021 RepID=A0AAN6VPH8_9PEZI|nr:hypothetical protein C8A00DRAFT_31735 [Chaetomidium leptoderma]